MRIIVTGGAGFIGSAFIRHIIKNSNEDVILNIDKLTYAGNLESLKNVEGSPRYSFEKIDICDYDSIKKIFSVFKPDALINFAAESHVDRSIDGPANFIKTNILGTFNLLEVAREYIQKNEIFRFHHVSTDEVFGDLRIGDPKFNEQTPYAPSSPYSATKASSDHLVRAWGRTYGIPFVITNCSNNYGPYHFPEKLIPHIILNALKGKPLPVYGDGCQIRDWLYVDDHVKALELVLKKGFQGETYTIGGNNELRNIDVVKEICRILEELAPSAIRYESLITYVKDRPGHDLRYAIDTSKIQNELGWSPEESFSTGLMKTVRWYLKNEYWWKKILDGSYTLDRIGVDHDRGD